MLRKGDQIGPYTLIRPLGQGGFGMVWLAERRTVLATTQFAVKFPMDDLPDLDKIRQEAATWQLAGGHPNVLPIIEANVYDDRVVIVSEYAPEGPLDKWLEKQGGRAPSLRIAMDLMNGILAGLVHLHEKRVVHRDLKPPNILLQGTTPRISDFGIARVLKTDAHSTATMGTVAYMAPEAFSGERNEKTDIWSAGVIFFQLAGGVLPFPHQDTASLVKSILFDAPRDLPGWVPEPLRSLIQRALQKDPALRYGDAREFQAATEQVRASLISQGLDSLPHQVPPGSAGPSDETTPMELLVFRPAEARETGPPPGPGLSRGPEEAPAGQAVPSSPPPAAPPDEPTTGTLRQWLTRAASSGKPRHSLARTAVLLALLLATAGIAGYFEWVYRPDGYVSLQAVPWGRLRQLRDAGGREVPVPDDLTPLRLVLPAGGYSALLQLGPAAREVRITFVVRADQTTRVVQVDPEFNYDELMRQIP